jgi:hypothetical protein
MNALAASAEADVTTREETHAARLQRLEHLVDVLTGALARITTRTMDADSDLGQRVMVRGDIAHGAMSMVRGIAEQAMAEAFDAADKYP